MQKEVVLRIDPRTASDTSLLKKQASAEAGVDVSEIQAMQVIKKSIDARQRQIYFNMTIRLYVNEPAPVLEYQQTDYPDVSGKPAVIVVGAGPAGLFAALRLIELHLRPIVLERGKNVHERRKDIALISRQHQVNPESNYAFGEGGAGAYSDGKLFTRSTKRGKVDKILNVFCQHGASTSILSDAHPHIGTDKLPAVIESMRNTIISRGGEVHFETRVNALILREACVTGVSTDTGEEFIGPVILATGHSARDVYRFLYKQQVLQEAKGLAIGTRLEHDSHLIDAIMYHNPNGRGKYLPAAEYRMSAQVDGRGVYSFCMCPGGFVIPAASGEHQVVVNGMSPSGRNSRWSNSGMVVEIRPEDMREDSLKKFMSQIQQDDVFAADHERLDDTDHPLRMMFLQEALEYECWRQSNGRQTAPSQRMTDFVNSRLSAEELPVSSYSPGGVASPLHFWLPRYFTRRLQEGLKLFGKRYHGFLTKEALMLAIETRTSSPVRIPRDKEHLTHVMLSGLYPCGEGAGYAGGIVSAAIDGEHCAEAVAASAF